MSTKRSRNKFPAVLTGMFIYTISGVLSISYSDVTSSGLGTTVTVNETTVGVYDITGGARPGDGTNLFHSFGDFSVDTTQSAVFLNDSGLTTNNIISRVTDGNPSNIYGTIDSTNFGGANMFLINPAGIVFGANAQLNVGGSFHATTADYIKLGTDGIFYAELGQGSNLTMSAPSAFGFLDANPGSIEVHTGGIDFDTFLPTALLEVPEGETLSLVGGAIDLGTSDFSTSGFLLAPAGTVNIVSVASAGEVTLGTPDSPISADGFAQLGDINISGGSIVDAQNIYIRGGNLTIDESVLIPGGFAFELSFVGYSPLPDGGEVNIKVTDNLIMTGTDLELLTLAAPGIFVYTGDFFDISPAAKLPDINIDAGSVYISGVAGISATRNAPGENGNVTINADDITIESGGSINLINAYVGDDPDAPGPSLTINAQTVNVSGDGSASAYGFEGIAAQGQVNLTYLDTQFGADVITANSGNINITATESLSVTGLGQITTDSRIFGSAGDITINTGNLLVAGTGDANSAVIGSQSAFAGNAGNIEINATGNIALTDGARITSSSFGSGDAGDVTVTAAGPITLDGADTRIVGGTVQLPDSTLNNLFLEVFYWYDFNTAQADSGNPNASLMEVLAYLSDFGDINIPNLDLTPGDGGTITITTPTLTMGAGTRIETSTGWEGNAGNVTANVGSLFVNDGARISSRSGIEFLDGTSHVGPGDGGTVTINATDNITISGTNSTISTSTFGDGNGGNIILNADNAVYIQNGGLVAASSGGTLAGQELAGSGLAGDITISAGNDIDLSQGTISTRAVKADGGNINLIAPKLTILDSSSISASSLGAGQAGKISANSTDISLVSSSITSRAEGAGNGGAISMIASNTVSMESGSSVSASSLGDGMAGNISIDAGNTFDITGSSITSRAEGAGNGGDVSVTASNAVNMQDGSSISASSLGAGLAGNISIDAGNTFEMTNSSITTQAVESDGGDITLVAEKMVYLEQSEITTSVESGTGGGGNIDIDPDFVILKSSNILANAFGGPGGNITIVAGNFIATPDSTVDASSALGIDGTVNISSPDESVSEDLAVLPENYLDVTSLLSERCGTTAGASSLVDAGPGGRIVDPDGYLPSFAATTTNHNNEEKNGENSVSKNKDWWASYAQRSSLQLAQMTCKF